MQSVMHGKCLGSCGNSCERVLGSHTPACEQCKQTCSSNCPASCTMGKGKSSEPAMKRLPVSKGSSEISFEAQGQGFDLGSISTSSLQLLAIPLDLYASPNASRHPILQVSYNNNNVNNDKKFDGIGKLMESEGKHYVRDAMGTTFLTNRSNAFTNLSMDTTSVPTSTNTSCTITKAKFNSSGTISHDNSFYNASSKDLKPAGFSLPLLPLLPSFFAPSTPEDLIHLIHEASNV